MRCDFGCLLAAAGDNGGRLSSLVISSSRRAVQSCVSCLLAAHLASAVSSHRRLISSLVVSPVSSPFFDTVGRGVRRGASGVLLAWFCPAVCADIDSRFTPFPLRCLLGLLACWLGCGAAVLSSHPCGCVAMSLLTARRLVSFLVSSIIPSVGSVLCFSRPVFRHDGRGGGRMRRCYSSLFPPVSSPRACLPRVVFSPSI